MAITVVSGLKAQSGIDGLAEVLGSIAGPNPYAAGGFAADIKTDFGLTNEPDFVEVVEPTDTYRAVWLPASKKIFVRVCGTDAEAGAIDLSGKTFYVKATIRRSEM